MESYSEAWMVSAIMAEWLHWLAREVDNRKHILLLMDNFSAHIAAVNLITATTPLQNIAVVYLPPNATSVCQPLDQGIIKCFKSHCRRRWVQYMLTE